MLNSDSAAFATGSNYPDALAGGALAGKLHTPILLR
ncbi:cell wall-binding repeat-containing protein [Bifidobacterium dentium]